MSVARILLPAFLLSWVSAVAAEPFARWDERQLVLDNGVVRRTIAFDAHGLGTRELTLAGLKPNLVAAPAEEFGFTLNDGRAFTGQTGWTVLSCARETDELAGDGASVTLQAEGGLKVRVVYLLYPNLPVIRKRLVFENSGTADLAVENLDIERLQLPFTDVDARTYTDYGRRLKIGPYVGDWHDAIDIVHRLNGPVPGAASTQTESWGIACGNEASGVTKRFSAFTRPSTVTIGLTHTDQGYAFRKWLAPGATWTSPWVFIVPYGGGMTPAGVLNGPVNDFVRRHMGIRLARIPQRPTFVYNTWVPFGTEINEGLIMELAKQAAEMGFEEFVIDDGWQANDAAVQGKHPIGDWLVNKEKFPRGLKPVFDYIKSLGMKPGLWFSLGAASTNSRVFTEHPDWFVQGPTGALVNLHTSQEQKRITACLATGWKDYFRDTVLRFVREYGLEYVKLDLAIVTTVYRQDPAISGCYATNHPGHRDRAESFAAEYDALWQLFDELHAEAPALFIDCTFEAMGKLHLTDYALCQHAEGNWLSNYTEWAPEGSLRVRQMAWWRSPAMPAASLVIGNQQLEDPGWELSLQSLAGTFPIFLGDLRQVPAGRKERIRQWADWLRRMEQDYGASMYRQDLAGFGEPQDGAWDGFSRLNTDTGAGGFVAVFRQNALERSRRIFVPQLRPEKKYAVRRAPEGDTLAILTGREMAEVGFPVTLDQPVGAALFEIRPQ